MSTNNSPGRSNPLLSAAGPVLCIAVSYVGPGKWVATIEGSARLGYDMGLFMLIMSLIGVLFQYLSACIAIATGKDLAHICREEYDNVTCIYLGIQAEISMILLDITLVAGSAYGLNAISGIDLFYCIFFTGFDVVIFPFVSNFVGYPRLKFLPILSASVALLSYFFGVLATQPERSLSVGGLLENLTGENAYALMALLGANVMPHNFYLHSSIVQMDQGQAYASKVALCHYHFFATLCIFSGIFLADCMFMNLSASVFYESGLVSLGLLDALSLLDQAFRSRAASFALLVFIFFLNHLVALTWSIGRQAVTKDLFKIEIPGWLHRAAIRKLAIIPALYCVWNAGSEGVFQLLIFTEVVASLLLPSSVIPLFRIASCKMIMGECKVSQVVEVMAFIAIIAMLGLKIVFVMEMIFGTSEWVRGLSWNLGSVLPIPYHILLVCVVASIFFSLFLVTSTLRSASGDARDRKWDEKDKTPELSLAEDEAEICEVPFHVEKCIDEMGNVIELEKSVTEHQDITVSGSILNLPETLLDFDNDFPSTTIQGQFESALSKIEKVKPDESAVTSETLAKTELPDASTLGTETERMLSMKLDTHSDKDDLSLLEHEESSKVASEGNLSSGVEGPGSLIRTISGIDELGGSTGSISRLAGLGRSARRQLTVILDDFWGQLFGYHGEVTDEAKAKKLNVLLGVDFGVGPKSSSSVKMENISQLHTGAAPDSLQSSSYITSSNQQLGQSGIGSPPNIQRRPGAVTKQMGFYDSYERNSSFNITDIMERRYFSLRTPLSSNAYDQQPATVHGYDMSSYLGQFAKEKGLVLPQSHPDSSSVPSLVFNSAASYGRQSTHRPLSGLRNLTPPGFHNVPAARNNALKSERYLSDVYSSEAEDRTNIPSDVKKYHSLPSISRLYGPQVEYSMLSSSPLRSNSVEQSFNRPAHEQIAASLARPASGFNNVFTPKGHDDVFSLQFRSGSVSGSVWPKQPFEPVGVACSSPQIATDAARIFDAEAKLLQSFRSCIIRLLKLEGSEWLFGQQDGIDEDVISRVASREKFLCEVESKSLDRKLALPSQINETDQSKFMPVPNCGDGCIWCLDLIISFGVWCIHRILDLSLIESRPELWGKYTYVLNRLQGILDTAFGKPRTPHMSCFCLQLPAGYQQMYGTPPPISPSNLPPPPKSPSGKLTTAAMVLEMIKDVEIAVSSRKGRSGTAAGDVAFPKGKENLASVLKRYKRRLANKIAGSPELGPKPT